MLIIPTILFLVASAPTAAAGTSCTTTDTTSWTCTFLCNPGDKVYVWANDTVQDGTGWPSIIGSCGGQSAECQANNRCSAVSSGTTTSGTGTCELRTSRTTGTCHASGGTVPKECTTVDTTSLSCQFACASGDKIYVWANDTVQDGTGWPSAIGSCGGQSAECQANNRCSAVSSGTTSAATGTCDLRTSRTTVTCRAAGATTSPPPTSKECSVTELATSCSFSCSSGDKIYVWANDTLQDGTGWPSIKGECSGAIAECQANNRCSAVSSGTSGAGTGACNLLTSRTNGKCRAAPEATAPPPPPPAECSLDSAVSTSCSFSCSSGDKIYVWANDTVQDGTGWPSIKGECSAAVAECQANNKCSAVSSATASAAGTGTCSLLTSRTTGTCRAAATSAPPPPATSKECTTVDTISLTCNFSCSSGDKIYVWANDTVLDGGGWPSIKGECGGQVAECQANNRCSAISPGTTTSGTGLCTLRTSRTTGTCRAAAPSTTIAAPTLAYTGQSGYESDGVHPNVGDLTTQFVFRVKYTSAAGLAPSYVRVIVDGVAYSMSHVSGTASGGAIYERSLTLGEFHHAHEFEASDGTRAATGTPTGLVQRPDVGPALQSRNALMLMPGFNPPALVPDWTREIKGYWGARDSNFRGRLAAEGWNLDSKAVYWGFYECDWSDPNTPGTADFVWKYGKDPLDPHAHGNSNHGDGRTYAQNHGGSTGTCAGKHDRDTSIEHLAYHWAWGVSKYEEARGWPCVDVLAHSMGGAIVRYAIAEVQRGTNADFPSRLCVDSAVTLSSPHQAVSNFQVGGCSNTFEYYQCDEMNGESHTALYQSMADAAGQDPKGTNADGSRPGKTTWTIVGTAGDQTIPGAMATGGMAPAHKIYYDEDIGHSSYFDQPSFNTDSPTARARVTDRGFPEQTFAGAPWPTLWADRSLAYNEHACGVVGGPKGVEYARLRNGISVTGEPPAPPMLACGYVVPDVPSGATLKVRMVSHEQGRTWSVYHVNSLGLVDVQPAACTKPPRAAYQECVVSSAAAGTWRVEVDVTDAGSANTIVTNPFLIEARY